MWSVVARDAIFGMEVASMISAEQRAIETVASINVSHSDICLNAPYLLRSSSTELVVRLGAPLDKCLKTALNSIPRAVIGSAGSNN